MIDSPCVELALKKESTLRIFTFENNERENKTKELKWKNCFPRWRIFFVGVRLCVCVAFKNFGMRVNNSAGCMIIGWRKNKQSPITGQIRRKIWKKIEERREGRGDKDVCKKKWCLIDDTPWKKRNKRFSTSIFKYLENGRNLQISKFSSLNEKKIRGKNGLHWEKAVSFRSSTFFTSTRPRINNFQIKNWGNRMNFRRKGNGYIRGMQSGAAKRGEGEGAEKPEMQIRTGQRPIKRNKSKYWVFFFGHALSRLLLVTTTPQFLALYIFTRHSSQQRVSVFV